MRVFAGPNGSGKTTILRKLQGEIPFGVYVNADDIERMLIEAKVILFDVYQLNVNEMVLQDFFKSSTFSPVKRNEVDLWSKLKVKNNVLHINTKIDSYLAADLAEFIRQQLVEDEISFTYETVMSHVGKVDFMETAQKKGYKVYLYFVATESPEININRVDIRVSQNGHFVSPELIRKSYFKSLNLFHAAVKNTNRAYVFDNSSNLSLLVAEITDGCNVEIIDLDRIPNWFIEYLIEK